MNYFLSEFYNKIKAKRIGSGHFLLLASIFFILVAISFVWLNVKKDTNTTPVTNIIVGEIGASHYLQTLPEVIPAQLKSVIVTVRRRDSLQRIFKRTNLQPKDAKAILSLKAAHELRNLRSGKKITLLLDPATKYLNKLIYCYDETSTLTVTNARGFRVNILHVEPVMRLTYVSSTIQGSVYRAAKKAGLSNKIANNLSAIYANKAAFPRGVRKGDKLAVFYRELYVGDKKIHDGDIAAAELACKDKVYRVVGFKDSSGITDYYTTNGYSLKSPFIRYPLKFNHVGSRFTLARYHPILGIVRAHLGVDLVAPKGTPVKATSSGRVAFAGRDGGYGNVVIIEHGKYTTLYAHLSKFNGQIFAKRAVKQGQIIGYVGATGLATGPHLHYEFRVNGAHYDPMSVKLPIGEMIAAEHRKQFFTFSREIVAKLDLQRHTSLAMHQVNNSKL